MNTSSSRIRPDLGLVQLGVAATLVAAGIAHLLLTPEHLAESGALGAGFAVAGIVQLALAVPVLTHPSRNVLRAVAVISALLIALYVWNVLLGLPLVGPGAAGGEHGHEAVEHAHESGLILGLGEPVDLAGALTKAAELLALVGSVVLLRRRAV